ncbi:MAG: TonB-dependent receptor plug domain-containing protein, partial [bacterium]
MAVYSAIAAMLVLGPPATAAENSISLPEEMLVVGDPNTAMDVLAGATTTRIDAGVRLLEGVGLDDLLAEVPGVQIRRFGGTGEPFEISIRGSSPQQVPVFLDGVRIESALTSRSDLSVLCLDVLDEIQVTRGPGAARSGSGAIGGVVNL